MRWIFKLFLCTAALLLVQASELVAKDVPSGGFVRIANAVGGGLVRLRVELDGKPLNERGLRAGDVTGGLWLSTGEHCIQYSTRGARSVTQVRHVQAGETVVLIVHAVQLPASHGKAVEWGLRVRELKAYQPVKGKTVTAVVVSRRSDLRMELGQTDRSWSGVTMDSGEVKRQPLGWPHGYVPLRLNGKRLTSIPVASDVNYTVVLYDDFVGKVRALAFKDRIYGGS